MTKEEWQNSTNIIAMLRFAKLSKRKERLFACNCVRHIWHLLKNDRSKIAVEVAELYADSKATKKELEQTRQDAWNVADFAANAAATYTSYNVADFAAAAAYNSAYSSAAAYTANTNATNAFYYERKWQADLLRHMVKLYD